MAKHELVKVYDQHIPRHIRNFLEALTELNLHFTSRSLENIYQSQEERKLAVARAMRICSNMGMPVEQHFRRCFIVDITRHTTEEAWRMSKIAYCLALLNGDPDNPMVGRIQWELLKRMV